MKTEHVTVAPQTLDLDVFYNTQPEGLPTLGEGEQIL